MRSHKEYLSKQMQDPDFADAYNALALQYQIARAIIASTIQSGLPQSNIGRLESGTLNPTVPTLEKVAAGLGKKLEVSST